jgi:hypothetical protein
MRRKGVMAGRKSDFRKLFVEDEKFKKLTPV